MAEVQVEVPGRQVDPVLREEGQAGHAHLETVRAYMELQASRLGESPRGRV